MQQQQLWSQHFHTAKRSSTLSQDATVACNGLGHLIKGMNDMQVFLDCESQDVMLKVIQLHRVCLLPAEERAKLGMKLEVHEVCSC